MGIYDITKKMFFYIVKIGYSQFKGIWYNKSIQNRYGFKEVDKMYSIYDVANWFLSKESMTNKKLQKLCYYAQAWSYALNNCPLINENFEAWVHGPVNRQLWKRLRDYGYLEIERGELSKNSRTIDNPAAKELLEDVWATYGEYSGEQLEALTHREPPWINAREGCDPYQPSNREINPSDMRYYYKSLIANDGDGIG